MTCFHNDVITLNVIFYIYYQESTEWKRISDNSKLIRNNNKNNLYCHFYALQNFY